MAEIAENLRISRQGVHDVISRGLTALQDHESRLQLMHRRALARQAIDQARQAIDRGDLATATEQLDTLTELL